MTLIERTRPFRRAWPSRPCSLRRTPSRARTPGLSPLRSLPRPGLSGPVSRSGAAHAPSGVSTCCSSPLAHRALITITACLSGEYFAARTRPPCRPSVPLHRAACEPPSETGTDVRHACDRYLASPSSASVPVTRNALGNALRRLACSKQSSPGCKYAPLPGPRAAGSATSSPLTATTRSKSDLTARLLHPTHVRITDPDTTGDEDRIAA